MAGIQLTEVLMTPKGEFRIYKDENPSKQKFFETEITKTKDLVRLTAYKLWKDAKEPEGMADHFWFEAEKMLDQEGYDLSSEYLMSKGYYWHPLTKTPLVLDPNVHVDTEYKPLKLVTRYAKKLIKQKENDVGA